ncbi:MAG TPA: peptidylprolyl isomerase [Hyphomicrobiaceae bacterium]|nr:peptidylprolyl isomerase [Hyphomicrobiaceae bacterium]
MIVHSTNGCSVKPAISRKPATVSVNGVVISRAAIARETQNHPAAKPIEAWLAAARALVVRELLLQEAKRLAIAPEPVTDEAGRRETDEEALVRQLVEREVATPSADADVCRRYYETNPERFRSADLYEARHVLIAADPRDGDARAQAKAQAEIVLGEVQRDRGLFAGAAEAYSACPSGKTGGSLGQIGPGQTVPEFEAALARMAEGDIALVESRYGFHVVLLERRIPGRELPFDLVKDRIAAWMEERVRRTAIRQYISILAGRATVTGIDLGATQSPLVQ